METNKKNLLQEYCQKNKLNNPVYHSKQSIDGWISTATITIKDKVYCSESDSFKKKVWAEINVASKLLETIESDIISENDNVKDIIYVIDLENKPVFGKKLNNDNFYFGFITDTHGSYGKYNDWHPINDDNIEDTSKINNKLLFSIHGGYADLADHYMTCMMYPILSFCKNKKLTKMIIVSGDKAAWCTMQCGLKIMDNLNYELEIKISSSIQ